MSRGVKIALIIFGVLFALLATCVAGGYYWWSNNGEGLMESAKLAREEGQTFGAEQANAEACMVEGIRRSAECGQLQISCITSAQMFTDACLESAPPDAAMCEGVPPPTEIIDTAKWSTEECARRDQAGNQACGNIVSALQRQCDLVESSASEK